MKIFFIFFIFLYFMSSCGGKSEFKYEQALPQLLSEELITTMPGKLIVTDRYLVWENPFSRDYFVHVHDRENGEPLGCMGAVGQGPEEFITGGINSSCINNLLFAADANGNTKGYLSLDSLIQKKKTFISLSTQEEAQRLEMGEWENNVFIGMTEDDDPAYWRANINGYESTFGVYPIPEVNQHLGGNSAYDAASGLFITSSFAIPYLALYKKDKHTFTLQWEVHPETKTYDIAEGRIDFDRKTQGVRGICMSKDYIVTLQRDQVTDPLDESTAGRDASKCPRTVFLYDYEGQLVRIVDLGIPVMRIASDRTSNALYAIGVNPDFALVKYEL